MTVLRCRRCYCLNIAAAVLFIYLFIYFRVIQTYLYTALGAVLPDTAYLVLCYTRPNKSRQIGVF